MDELFDAYRETVIRLLARLDADLADRCPTMNVQWTQAVSEIRQSMNEMHALPPEELDAAVREQRGRLVHLGALYWRLSGSDRLD